jgi:CubicO group peptidase (beta-lactamase class C family)
MFFAMGYPGQYLLVLPAEDLVVVFFSNLSLERSVLPLELLDRQILPALR